MADQTDPVTAAQTLSDWANTLGVNSGDPRVNAQLRQRIALQMMLSKGKAYPKNIGEGLSAIGDSLGDLGIQRRLEAADVAQQGVNPPPPAATAPPPQQTSDATPALPPNVANAQASIPTDAPVAAAPSWRDSIAAQVNSGSVPGVPPVNPTLPGADLPPSSASSPSPFPAVPGGPTPDQRVASADLPQQPNVATDITPAPPVPSGIRQAPVQLAQAQTVSPPGDPGYVTPKAPTPPGAQIIPLSPREIQLLQWKAANQGNPYAAMKVDPELSALANARTIRQGELNKIFEAQVQQGTTQNAAHYQNLADQAKRQQDVQATAIANQKAQLELGPAVMQAGIKAKTGQDAGAFITQLQTVDQPAAQRADNIIRQSQLVQDALKHDVITGYGADKRLDMTKARAYWLKSGSAEDLATYTERLQAALKSTLSVGLENLSAGPKAGVRLTPGAIDIASGTTGADPTATKGAIQAIVSENARLARRQLGDYEAKVNNVLGDYPQVAKTYQFTTTPTAPNTPVDYTRKMLENRNNPTAIADYDARFGEGAAELEIARAQRRAQRGG